MLRSHASACSVDLRANGSLDGTQVYVGSTFGFLMKKLVRDLL